MAFRHVISPLQETRGKTMVLELESDDCRAFVADSLPLHLQFFVKFGAGWLR